MCVFLLYHNKYFWSKKKSTCTWEGKQMEIEARLLDQPAGLCLLCWSPSTGASTAIKAGGFGLPTREPSQMVLPTLGAASREMPSCNGATLSPPATWKALRPCVHVCTEGLGRNQMSNYPENLVLAISKQAIIRRHTIHPAVGFVLIIPSLSPPQSTAHWLAKLHELGHTEDSGIFRARTKALRGSSCEFLPLCLCSVGNKSFDLLITQPGLVEAIKLHGFFHPKLKCSYTV